jgi:hypothetical protein
MPASRPTAPAMRLPSPPAESIMTISQSENINLDNETFKKDLMTASQMDSFVSDIQSTTVKQEDMPTEDRIKFKMRKKVCRKIRSILVNDLGLKIVEAERLTLDFEQAIFVAYSENTLEYIQAIKSICNKVKVADRDSRQKKCPSQC